MPPRRKASPESLNNEKYKAFTPGLIFTHADGSSLSSALIEEFDCDPSEFIRVGRWVIGTPLGIMFIAQDTNTPDDHLAVMFSPDSSWWRDTQHYADHSAWLGERQSQRNDLFEMLCDNRNHPWFKQVKDAIRVEEDYIDELEEQKTESEKPNDELPLGVKFPPQFSATRYGHHANNVWLIEDTEDGGNVQVSGDELPVVARVLNAFFSEDCEDEDCHPITRKA